MLELAARLDLYNAMQALSGSGIGKVKLVPVLLEKVSAMFVT